MKKLLTLMLALIMLVSFTACANKAAEAPAPEAPAEAPAAEAPAAEAPAEAPAEPEKAAPVAEEVRGVTIPAFAATVNGVAVNQDAMAAYPIYSVQATSINSAGTESTTTYVGFKFSDVLAAAGMTESYVWLQAVADDGYALTFTDAELITADTTLLAMTKDGSPFAAAPWFAPCADTTTGNYLKGCTTLLVNTVDGAPEVKAEEAKPEEAADAGAAPAGLPEISDKTDKVTFEPFSFKVNGEEVTNDTLAGLHIFKITAVALNSKGESVESAYTGYKLADVLEACGVKDAKSVKAIANDGYASELDADIIGSDHTLVAIEKDKELGEDGTIWLAPCSLTETKAFCKLVVEITAE